MEYDLSFLENIYKKLSDYEAKTHSEGTDISILQIAGKEQSEVVICRLISFLLNPNEKHGQKEKFLNLFLQKIGEVAVSENELKSLQVITEFPANRRRIDIVIKSNKRFLPFEVKIWATDQNTQCKDYYDFAKVQHPVGAKKIFYLTIDGHEPNESSMDKLKDEGHLELLSFRNHVLSWLEQCENDKDSYSPILQEYIRELKLAVRKFCGYTENQRMNEEILKEIIDDEKKLKAAKAICSIEKEIRPDLLWKEFCTDMEENSLNDDWHEYPSKAGDGIDPITVHIMDDEVSIDFSFLTQSIFINTENNSLKDKIKDNIHNSNFVIEFDGLNENGIRFKSASEIYLGACDFSPLDLYKLFKFQKEEIINRMNNFIEIVMRA
ncbi:PD-(D/E)XK nuclease family protein [Treponema sp.]|uniref:PDDEXK-like family protein n=1 Tax=Treponema sp. TaxID=166 RepID=UPI0025794AD3|nr:PD-(D/E)XK nuclease family protein [Treponema sp.]MBE6355257.1 hypothetical protein [Treponema sp.]